MFEDFKYALMHKNGCGGPCFYMRTKPTIYSDPTQASEALKPNGSFYDMSDRVYCGSCNKVLFSNDIIPGYVEEKQYTPE